MIHQQTQWQSRADHFGDGVSGGYVDRDSGRVELTSEATMVAAVDPQGELRYVGSK